MHGITVVKRFGQFGRRYRRYRVNGVGRKLEGNIGGRARCWSSPATSTATARDDLSGVDERGVHPVLAGGLVGFP